MQCWAFAVFGEKFKFHPIQLYVILFHRYCLEIEELRCKLNRLRIVSEVVLILRGHLLSNSGKKIQIVSFLTIKQTQNRKTKVGDKIREIYIYIEITPLCQVCIDDLINTTPCLIIYKIMLLLK